MHPEPHDLHAASNKADADLEAVAYELIKQKIVSGELLPGAKLSQSEMAVTLGVSRTPVRAAFQRLRTDGLIAMTSEGGRPVVAPVSGDELEVLYEMLGVLEGLAARMAAKRLTSLQASLLRAALEVPEDASSPTRGESIHRLVVEAVNSPVLTRSVAAVRLPLSRYRNLFVDPDEARPRSDAYHHQIVDALVAGDGERAEKVMIEHLADAFAAIVEALRRSGHVGTGGVLGFRDGRRDTSVRR